MSRANLARTFSAIAVMLATVACTPPKPRLPVAQTEPLRQSVHVGAPLNADIGYLRAGDAKGTRLILVHGTPGSAEGWTDYVLDPPAGVEVIALDRPGFGNSGPEAAVTGLALQAAAVAALLPMDGRKAVLLGHSLGGAVIAQVAAEYPDRVAALVLLASSLDPAQEAIHPLQPLAAMWPMRSLLPRALRNANAELMDFKGELDALAPLLARINVPYIIVHGTKDDLVPFANVAYMQRMLVNARCGKTVVLPDQNHFLPWNSESTVRDAIQWALKPSCPNP
jgi:pimeloyl-ACP methyl ester carboxylesterase